MFNTNKEISLFFIPNYTYEALMSSKVTLEEIENLSYCDMDYETKGDIIESKIENVVSKYDIIELKSINKYLYNKLYSIDANRDMFNSTFNFFFNINNKYNSYSDETAINDFNNNFTDDEIDISKELDNKNNSLYKFIMVNSTLYIIYNKGFANVIINYPVAKDNKLQKQFNINVIDELFNYLCDEYILKSVFFKKAICKYLN